MLNAAISDFRNQPAITVQLLEQVVDSEKDLGGKIAKWRDAKNVGSLAVPSHSNSHLNIHHQVQ